MLNLFLLHWFRLSISSPPGWFRSVSTGNMDGGVMPMQESLQLSLPSHITALFNILPDPSRCFLITPNLSGNRILNHLLLTLETLPQSLHPSSMESSHSLE